MNKVIVINDGESNVYDIVAPATAESIAAQSGVTDPSLYEEFPESDFDEACYNYPDAFTLSAGVVGFSLDAAKERASQLEKERFNTAETAATVGFSPNQLASQAALAEVDRLPEMQAVIDAVNVIAVELSSNLTAIAAATDINEVNNIIYPPTGVIHTGRGNMVLNQTLLQASDYVEFNSASATPADTELYSPGTDKVVSYNSGTNSFPLTPNFFVVPDFRVQIRYAATGSVIAEFELPTIVLGGQDIPFGETLPE